MKYIIKLSTELLEEPFEETFTITGSDMDNKFTTKLRKQATFYNTIRHLKFENTRRQTELFAKKYKRELSFEYLESKLVYCQLHIVFSTIEKVIEEQVNGSPEAWLAVFKLLFDTFNVVKIIHDVDNFSYFNFAYIIQKGE